MNKTFHRRHLPHLHFAEGIYFVTARLFDQAAISKFKKLKSNSDIINKLEFYNFKDRFMEYDRFLDKETGLKLYLKDPAIANLLSDSILSLDSKEYKLIAYTIMPNHFHLVFELLAGNGGLSKIMQLIKGRSAYYINKQLNQTGKLWQDESYDRWVRDDKELYFIINYILLNPVNAGLVETWSDWKFTFCKEEFLTV